MEANKMTENLLDAAACEALGSHSHEESAAYQHELAAAGTSAHAVDRQMRQTVATLAAASPHMKPSDDLRARILQATAPRSFRLEDYRKASGEDMRFYKWGFYAAAVFLVLAGLYNINVRSGLDTANANYNKLHEQAQALAKNDQEQIGKLLSASLAQGNAFQCLDDKGRPFAYGTLNVQTKTAVMYLPEELVAAGIQPQLNLDVNGVQQKFKTSVVAVPAQMAGLFVPEQAKIPAHFEFRNQAIDPAPQIRNASILH